MIIIKERGKTEHDTLTRELDQCKKITVRTHYNIRQGISLRKTCIGGYFIIFDGFNTLILYSLPCFCSPPTTIIKFIIHHRLNGKKAIAIILLLVSSGFVGL